MKKKLLSTFAAQIFYQNQKKIRYKYNWENDSKILGLEMNILDF